MNIRNLETIHKILIEHANSAKDNYDNYRSCLREKYKTDWLIGVATEEEKSALKIWEGIYSDAEEALTDFEQENW